MGAESSSTHSALEDEQSAAFNFALPVDDFDAPSYRVPTGLGKILRAPPRTARSGSAGRSSRPESTDGSERAAGFPQESKANNADEVRDSRKGQASENTNTQESLPLIFGSKKLGDSYRQNVSADERVLQPSVLQASVNRQGSLFSSLGSEKSQPWERPKAALKAAASFLGIKTEMFANSATPDIAAELFEFCLTVCMATAPEIMSFVEAFGADDKKALRRLAALAKPKDVMGEEGGGREWSFPAPIKDLVTAFLQESKQTSPGESKNPSPGTSIQGSAQWLSKSGTVTSLGSAAGLKRQGSVQFVEEQAQGHSVNRNFGRGGAGNRSGFLDVPGSGTTLRRSTSNLGALLGLKRSTSNMSDLTHVLGLKRSGTIASDLSSVSCSSFMDYNMRHPKLSNDPICRPSFLDFLMSLNQDVDAPTATMQGEGANMMMDIILPARDSKNVLDSVSEAGLSYHSVCDVVFLSEGDEKEHMNAEVVGINTGPNGQPVRMSIAFKPKCLRTQNEWQRRLLMQQKLLLNNVSNKLKLAEMNVKAGDELQGEQKELLRGFRKIVIREFAQSDQNVTVYIIERDDVVRKEVEELCSILEFPCQAFRNLEAASIAIKDAMRYPGLPKELSRTSHTDSGVSAVMSMSTPLLEGRPGQDCKDWRSQALISQTSPPASSKGKKSQRTSSSLPEESKKVRLVLLGSFLLESDLPPVWQDPSVFVCLTSQAEEFEEVGNVLFASGEGEIRENLRKRGISQYLMHPLSLEGVRGVVNEAFRKRFGQEYLLLQVLGRGASGVVHRAKCLPDGGNFALKEINTKRLGKQAKREVEQESKLLEELRWPTVVFLCDTWESAQDRLKYILMPLLDGDSLQSHSEPQKDEPGKKKVPRPTAECIAEWYAQCLHGLTYLHWRGVIHKDIKPSNLLLAADQRSLQIGDLGSAALLPGSGPHPMRRNTVTGPVTTPLYAAPEVLLGETYSAATDLWAVGASFYEVLTLQTFFPQGQSIEQLQAEARKYQYRQGPWPTVLAEVKSTLPPMLELPDIMQSDHLLRPTASELVGRSATFRRLRTNLGVTGALPTQELLKMHFDEFARIRSESNRAADMAPP